MATRIRKIDTPFGSSEDSIVAIWLKASADFYANHKKITILITTSERASDSLIKETQYIGQCPRILLIELAMAMQQELEKLLFDLEKTDILKQTATKQAIKNLYDHTTVLNELNDQAQIRLNLVHRSSS